MARITFRLRTKFLLSMLLILVALTSTSLLLVRRRVEQQLRAGILQDLANSVATFQNVQRQRALSLRHSAELLANLPISRAMMTTLHAATIQDASRELWNAAGADVLVLGDGEGRIMGIHASTSVDRDIAQQALQRSLTSDQMQDWWLAGNHLYQISIQPIYLGSPSANRILGFLAVGYEIDDRIARELSQVAASQVAFWYGKHLIRSTLPRAGEQNLVARDSEAGARSGMQPVEMVVGTEPFLVSSVSLAPGNPQPVRLTVLKSLTQVDALLGELNRLLLGLGLLAVLAGSAVVFFISKTFTQPLDNLVAGVRALGRGEYTFPLPMAGNDETAELTAAFIGMRNSLQQSQRELLDAERLATIGRMASSISHDLRHQLAAILANAEFMSEPQSDTERQELYTELRAAVTQMTDLIESLLEFSRPRESMRLSWVRLDEVLDHALQIVRARPEFRSKTIMAGAVRIEGWFDANKLQRVVQNLIINACEATPPEGAMITVSAGSRDRIVEIRVADNGRGIPDGIRDRIFEPFVSYGKENGTGLGLTIVQKIVQDHGGEVAVRETSPAGTIIVVSLPLATSGSPLGENLSAVGTDARVNAVE